MWKTMGIVEVMERAGQVIPGDVASMVENFQQRQQQNKMRREHEDEQFVKVLMVAEKPSVAKMMAEHLSGGRFRLRRGQKLDSKPYWLKAKLPSYSKYILIPMVNIYL